MLYRVVLTFESGNEELKSVRISFKATVQCFPVCKVLTSVLHKGVLTFESEDVNCDYSYET